MTQKKSKEAEEDFDVLIRSEKHYFKIKGDVLSIGLNKSKSASN